MSKREPAGKPDVSASVSDNPLGYRDGPRCPAGLAAILTEQAAPPELRKTPRDALDLLLLTTDRPLSECRLLVAAELREFSYQSPQISIVETRECFIAGRFSKAEGKRVVKHLRAKLLLFIGYAGEHVPEVKLRPVPDDTALDNEILRLARVARRWAEKIRPTPPPPPAAASIPTSPPVAEAEAVAPSGAVVAATGAEDGHSPPVRVMPPVGRAVLSAAVDPYTELRLKIGDTDLPGVLTRKNKGVLYVLCEKAGEWIDLAALAGDARVNWSEDREGRCGKVERAVSDWLGGRGWCIDRQRDTGRRRLVRTARPAG